MTYKEIAVEALTHLGGHAYYADIYEYVKINHPEKLTQKWRASIRASIERKSSDSRLFDEKEDLFYSVDGLGNGHWGLRNFNEAEHVELTQEDDEFSEGKLNLKQHLVRERNPRLINEAKKNFKRLHGRLFCQVCGFDFENVYGELGKDFIEAHHVKPVSEMKATDKTKLKDVIMVCSNCHSMIHRKKPWLNYEEIKNLLQ